MGNRMTSARICLYWLSVLALCTKTLLPQVGLAQQNAYNEAQRAFKARDYVNSARLFYSIAIATQGDMKQKSEYGLAESLRRAGFPYSAAVFYSRIVAQGDRSDFFRFAMDALGDINSEFPLGRATVASVVSSKINPLQVPPGARGFFFFYKGLELFDSAGAGALSGGQAVTSAKSEFERVPSGSPYYARAQYYLGVIQTVLKETDGALSAFNRVLRTANSDSLRQLANMNIARVYYEKKDYRRAFSYYSQIPRDSDLWLQTLFFPETYILNAITYLRLCRYPALRESLRKFQERYKPTFADLNNLLKKYNKNEEAFFNLIAKYRSSGRLGEFQASTEVIDAISRSDVFKEGAQVVRNIDREQSLLRGVGTKWEVSGLSDIIRTGFENRKRATIQAAGQALFNQAVQQFRYLKDLSDQTRLINLEMYSGRTDQLRARFNSETTVTDSTQWGEGMKPLNLKQELEYWPFEGEYWEDELGGYVYNIDSKCSAPKK
jgi:tetratricopeptide (TPR) repeat protein